MENRDIALVGISIYCPAGDSVEEFWQGISRGGDFITEVPEDVIEAYHFTGAPNPTDRFYCSRGGFLQNPLKVDPLRYGIMPIAAGGIDPEQLISLMGVEHALIDAGVFAKGIPTRKCSIIIGKGNFSGLVQMRTIEIMRMARQLTALLKDTLPDLTEGDLDRIREAYQSRQGQYNADMAIGTMPSLIASLVANRFDMQGPAYMLDAACASGIVAIDHSINLLRSGQCDLAVAGGMHAGHSSMFWGTFNLLGALSRKQVIAPFSEDADGLLIGQGGGFVVLKMLNKAVEDGDRIYAVIKETAVSSDGASTHVMVTSVEGQKRLLERTWDLAGMDPDKIGYVEAHGTGTIVGDKTELATLKSFFGDNSRPRAYVGSVKSNIGHTMPAAGMIGIIKTALSLYWRKIPPTLHCEKPQPTMFESRFLPPRELIDWDGEKIPLVAGVNAFGFGGINAHAIMTAYEPPPGTPRIRPKPYPGEALMISAPSGPALIEKLKNGNFIDTGGDYRLVIFDPDQARLRQAIAIVEEDKPCRGRMDIWFSNRPVLAGGGKIVYMFPGYATEWDAETDSISEAFDLPYMADLLPAADDADEADRIVQQVYNTKWLCREGLKKLGVEADMHTGHSVGEWDAALFAGVTEGNMFALSKTLFNYLRESKPYPLLAVSGIDRQMAEAWCQKLPDIWMACDNSPNQIMFCGKKHSQDALIKILEKENILHTVLPYGVGMHTPLVADVPRDNGKIFQDMLVHEGQVPVWSATALCTVPTEKEQYIDFLYDELAKPIYFRELIEKLYAEQEARIFIQFGFGSLAGFVEEILKGKDFGAITTSISARSGADQLRRVLALLFIEGRRVDPAFLGVKLQYRVEHDLMVLPNGMNPLLTGLPEIKEAVSKRYGGLEAGMGLSAGIRHSFASPVAEAVDINIRDAITVQREMATLFEQRVPVTSAPQLPALPPSYKQVSKEIGGKKPKSKKGEKFEENLHLSIEDHPYLVDHSIVRQPANWPFPEDLNPVVPFSMTIELFAEIAQKHAPGKKLIKIGNISAYKWISLEKPLDLTVKGEWLKQNVLRIDLDEHAQAECTFGDEWPGAEAKYTEETDIGEDILGFVPAFEMYEMFSFHGPQYHSLIRQKRICSRGMSGYARRQAGKGSLLDIMGQQLGLFLHLTQTENTISFPIRLKEVIFYDDIFDQEGTFETTMIVRRLTESTAVADIILKRGGKMWCVMNHYVAQRFQNIPALWKVILNPRTNKLAEEIAPNIYFYAGDSPENVMALMAKRYLATPDREIYEKLKSPRLKREHIISRIALKDAVRIRIAGADGEMLYPIEFYCACDENGRPFLKGYGRAAGKVEHLFVSLAHKETSAVAIVSESPVGIDLERIEAKTEDFLRSAFTEKEIELQKEMNDPDAAIRFWVAKEAYAKMRGEGLKGNPKRIEVSAVAGDILTIDNRRFKTMKLGADYIAGWTINPADSTYGTQSVNKKQEFNK
ncbi:MAG: 4'-phosphopantetheinyl transferase superfamily protein [Clostridiales bacterium]|jgi:3-oxoacyl-(acyl-carrier-protein) synthase/phosphopantetheinyl transferase/malonyl CoA-acyl carrier protein transacylase|nr:4'-phosphopantetheinyl transferase superfamily protein [Clostridiales bacterium]